MILIGFPTEYVFLSSDLSRELGRQWQPIFEICSNDKVSLERDGKKEMPEDGIQILDLLLDFSTTLKIRHKFEHRIYMTIFKIVHDCILWIFI